MSRRAIPHLQRICSLGIRGQGQADKILDVHGRKGAVLQTMFMSAYGGRHLPDGEDQRRNRLPIADRAGLP